MATKEKKPAAPKAAKAAKTPAAPKAPKTEKAPKAAAPKKARTPAKKSSGLSMAAVRKLAESKGASIDGLDKIEAVRAIQTAEGYTACFATAVDGQCDQTLCLFYEECLTISKPVEV